MFPAPRWLPYRLRIAWDGVRIAHALRGLDETRPLPAAAPDTADAEVQMLCWRRDFRLGVLALKSLLRFGDVNLAVSLTDDGSLSAPDREWVRHHIPGCRWLGRRVDDARLREVLASHPRLASLYNGTYHPICKLLHATLLAQSERVILLDPDTAFYRRPDLLIRWVRGQNSEPRYLQDHRNESEAVTTETREAFDAVAGCCTPAGRTWHMPHYFFNSGLLLFRPADLSLDVAERFLEWKAGASSRFRTGASQIWFGDWTPEQTAFQICFAVMETPASSFAEDYRLGLHDAAVFNHFLGHHLVQRATLRTLRHVIDELRRDTGTRSAALAVPPSGPRPESLAGRFAA